MTRDDKRHGTPAGSIAGCREECCRVAKRRYDKVRRWELHTTGQYRKVPAYRAARRIQALQALGWSVPQIGKVCGIDHRHLYYLANYETVYTSTLAAITAAYDALSMVIPPTDTTGQRISTARARNHAARMGWPPPLAWDDIDCEDEAPSLDAATTRWQANELLAEWDHLRRAGVDLTEAARRLGISRDGLQKAIERAGKRAA